MTLRSKMFQSICFFRSTRQRKWHDFLMMGKNRINQNKFIRFPNRSEPIGVGSNPKPHNNVFFHDFQLKTNETMCLSTDSYMNSFSFSFSLRFGIFVCLGNFRLAWKKSIKSFGLFPFSSISFVFKIKMVKYTADFSFSSIEFANWFIFFLLVISWKEEMVVSCCSINK